MAKFEGFIHKVHEKNGTQGNGKKWFKYSFLLTDGEIESPWLGLGFNQKFPLKEGDYITVEAEEKNGFWDVVKGTARVVKDPPQRKAAKTAAGTEVSATSTVTSVAIHFQSARKDAIEVIDLLLRNDALPVTQTKSKAGEATRYQQVLDAIDKLTVKYFHDTETLRILDSVADEGKIKEGSETEGDDEPAVVVPDADGGFDEDDDIAF